MSRDEWESLCDGCGKCCLNKYEDEALEIHFTDVACKLLDTKTCRCTNYPKRKRLVKDCVSLNPKNLTQMNCLPPTCAYRRLNCGQDLLPWHPLITGDPRSTIKAGMSVKGRVVREQDYTEEEIEERIVTWPKSTRSCKTGGK